MKSGPHSQFLEARTEFEQRILQGQSWSGHEKNCCFLNPGTTHEQQPFATVSATSGFDFADDGRAVASTDWDGDGDLDIWFVNRTGPQLRFLKNQFQQKPRFVSIRLVGKTANRDAIGARIRLIVRGENHVDNGQRIRTLRAGEGFLSQSSKWVHFGLNANEEIDTVKIRWPGGQEESFKGLKLNQRWIITEGDPQPRQETQRRNQVQLAAGIIPTEDPEHQQRVWLTGRYPLPLLPYRTEPVATSKQLTTGSLKQPTLVTLWASWCLPCLHELQELTLQEEQVRQAGLDVLALSLDGLQEQAKTTPERAEELLNKLKFPFQRGYANDTTMKKLVLFREAVFQRQQTFPTPTSFLLDAEGQLAAIYYGKFTLEQVLQDVQRLPVELANKAPTVSPDRWVNPTEPPSLKPLSDQFQQAGFTNDSLRFLEFGRFERAKQACEEATLFASRGLHDIAMKQFLEAIELAPGYALGRCNFAVSLLQQRKLSQASVEVRKAIELEPDLAFAHFLQGQIFLKEKQFLSAASSLRKSLQLKPQEVRTRFQLGHALMLAGKSADAITEFEELLIWEETHGRAMHRLSWLLATSEKSLRDPQKSIRLASILCKASGFQDPRMIDTLSAAYAANGQFKQAVFTAEIARDLAKKLNDQELMGEIQKHLDKFRNSEPWEVGIPAKELKSWK